MVQYFFYLLSETYSSSMQNKDTFVLDVILYDMLVLQFFFYVFENRSSVTE